MAPSHTRARRSIFRGLELWERPCGWRELGRTEVERTLLTNLVAVEEDDRCGVTTVGLVGKCVNREYLERPLRHRGRLWRNWRTYFDGWKALAGTFVVGSFTDNRPEGVWNHNRCQGRARGNGELNTGNSAPIYLNGGERQPREGACELRLSRPSGA